MLAFLGGTGPEGRGLALRYAGTGEDIIIGSRDSDKAMKIAGELRQKITKGSIVGNNNREAAKQGDIVFVSVPYHGQKPLISSLENELAGKLVINVVAPLIFNQGRPSLVSVGDGSAAMECQRLLPRSRIVSAFQNVSASKLMTMDKPVEGDVVVCSDHTESKHRVMELVHTIKNLRGVDGGILENARYVEQLTVLLININRAYNTLSAIKFEGV